MSGAKRAFLAALLILGGLGPARATTPIEIVLAPLYGAVASIRDFAPLRAHLQKTLGRPVESVSARDHASQLDQLRRHRYDYAVVPPHLAQQLSAEGRYHPLMTITGPDPVVLIAHHDPVETPREHLAGMRLALPDDASLASWTAQRVMPERLADARRYPNNLAAATAVEIVLRRLLDQQLSRIGDLGKNIGKGPHTLGKLITWLGLTVTVTRQFDVGDPRIERVDPQQHLAGVRNRTAHRGTAPTREEADLVMLIAESIVREHCPLALF